MLRLFMVLKPGALAEDRNHRSFSHGFIGHPILKTVLEGKAVPAAVGRCVPAEPFFRGPGPEVSRLAGDGSPHPGLCLAKRGRP